MTWSSHLESSVLLLDGRSRETPADARRLMLWPPGGEAPQKWQHLATLLMTTARTAHRNLVAITIGQIERRESGPYSTVTAGLIRPAGGHVGAQPMM